MVYRTQINKQKDKQMEAWPCISNEELFGMVKGWRGVRIRLRKVGASLEDSVFLLHLLVAMSRVGIPPHFHLATNRSSL